MKSGDISRQVLVIGDKRLKLLTFSQTFQLQWAYDVYMRFHS